jgi:hypothetical protein
LNYQNAWPHLAHKFNDHYVELHFGFKRFYGHVPFLAILCLFPFRSCLYGTKFGTQTLAILKQAFGHFLLFLFEPIFGHLSYLSAWIFCAFAFCRGLPQIEFPDFHIFLP